MDAAPGPINELFALLERLDGDAFDNYGQLRRRSYYNDRFLVRFVHIQGSPGAFPASLCHLVIDIAQLGIAESFLATEPRKTATADYLLRAFATAVDAHARQNRGAQGSGSYQPLALPPQVLERNLVVFGKTDVRIAFNVSLPGSRANRILGRQTISMFDEELTGIVVALKECVASSDQLSRHCEAVEDMVSLQDQLKQYGLVAFVGDGAVLPRQSGVSQAPLKKGAVPFHAPDDMAVAVDLPNAGRVRGMGIPQGVTVVIGGAYHGKSTLLHALAKGVYPHIPGDGRERVAVQPDAMAITAEEGRSVRGVDITGFVQNLPGQVDTRAYFTTNASGSTSEAASIIEAVQAGAGLLLLDEDTSATNFLIKDNVMRRLIPEDGVTPLFDRVLELHRKWGVSTLIVVGGSSEYLGVADHVIAMRHYRPINMTGQARKLRLPRPVRPSGAMPVQDNRRVSSDNFDPAYRNVRIGKTIACRIKPLRLRERILEYGDQQMDLTHLDSLVDPHQVLAVGYALLLARGHLDRVRLSPSDLAGLVDEQIQKGGLDILLPADQPQLLLARPRRLELAAAMNRLRNLQMSTIPSDP